MIELPPASREGGIARSLVLTLPTRGDDQRVVALEVPTDGFPVVFLQDVASDPDEEDGVAFLGLAPAEIESGGDLEWSHALQAVEAVSEAWFEGDPARAAWIVLTPTNWTAQIHELVVTIHDGRGAWDEVTAPIDASTVSSRIGTGVPAFLPELATVSAIEQWREAGHVAATPVESDLHRDERYAAAAALLTGIAVGPQRSYWDDGPYPVESLTAADVELLAALAAQRVDWERSGTTGFRMSFERPNRVRMTDLAGQVDQLVPAYHDFKARYRDNVTTTMPPDTLDERTSQRLLDAAGDAITYLYGPTGRWPAPSLAWALELARGLVRGSRREPFDIRVWRGERRLSAIGQWVDGCRADAPAKRRSAVVHGTERELRSYWGLGPDVEVEVLSDAQGICVLRATQDDGTPVFAAAVPVLRHDVGPDDDVARFTAVVVEADLQRGPIMLLTPRSPTPMPFGQWHARRGFTHGYAGEGPRNTSAAIVEFLGRVMPIDERVIRNVTNAVREGSQESQMRLTREQILARGTETSLDGKAGRR